MLSKGISISVIEVIHFVFEYSTSHPLNTRLLMVIIIHRFYKCYTSNRFPAINLNNSSTILFYSNIFSTVIENSSSRDSDLSVVVLLLYLYMLHKFSNIFSEHTPVWQHKFVLIWIFLTLKYYTWLRTFTICMFAGWLQEF